MNMFYKNIALVVFLSLLSFGGVTYAANHSFDVIVTDSDPAHNPEEAKNPKSCAKILKEAAKKQCVKAKQEVAKKKAQESKQPQEVVKAQTKPVTPVAEKVVHEDDEELITPRFGRTLYNFLKSLML